MFRRLTVMLRHWSLTMRHWGSTLRAWMREWVDAILTPFRHFSLRRFFATIWQGVVEFFGLIKLLRPHNVRSELTAGGWEFVSIVRSAISGAFGLVTSTLWLIITLPWTLIRACYHGPRWTWAFLRTRTKRQLVLILSSATIIFVAVTATPAYLYYDHRRTNRISARQQRYDAYIESNDLEKLEQSLESLAEVLPNDPSVARRLDMVRNRSASVSEPKLVRFFMRYHMQKGQTEQSVAEAEKLLESFPDDWESHCYLAEAALRKGDRSEAVRQISNLPNAGDVSETIPANVAFYSAGLFARLGDQARFDQIVDVIVINYLPELRSKELIYRPVTHKLFFIECYCLSLMQLEKRREQLTRYWEPAQIACKSVAEDPDADVPILLNVGVAEMKLFGFLREFLRLGLVSKDEFNSKATDLLERQHKIWLEVVKKDPKNQFGYQGLAELYYTIGQPQQAVAVITKGLMECGGNADLIAKKAEILSRFDPKAGLAFLESVLRDDDMSPKMCQVFEKVAMLAGRSDKALNACRIALRQDPKLYWARLREGEICLRAGQPTAAAAALRNVEDELIKDPEGCGLYVRALCDCGTYQLAEEFLEKATKSCPVDVLLRAADGLQAAGRTADSVRWAKRALEKEPVNVKARLIVADNTRLLAENPKGGWDRDLVRESLLNYRAVLQQQPDNLMVINNIVWLEAKALGLPVDAYESSARLRAIQDTVGINSEYLETLGVVYIGVEQYDLAVKMLRQAVSTSGARFGFYLHLALAHHGLRQPEMALKYLNLANEIPNKTDREKAELGEAIRIVLGR